jgi:hypothetical protein
MLIFFPQYYFGDREVACFDAFSFKRKLVLAGRRAAVLKESSWARGCAGAAPQRGITAHSAAPTAVSGRARGVKVKE